MKRLDLMEYNVNEISSAELKNTNGGIILLMLYGLYKNGKKIYESLQGAYQAGYDTGSKNCGCR